MKKLICLNLGHGGKPPYYDSGAMSDDGKTQEHLFNEKEFVPLLEKEFKARGLDVVTLEQNRSFGELPSRINATNADVLISVHSNSYSKTSTGTEVLYYSPSKRSKALAEILDRKIVGVLKLADRGAKGMFVGRGSAILHFTKMPAVILEPFFISNPNDLARVRECLPELAKAIADGVTEWFNPK